MMTIPVMVQYQNINPRKPRNAIQSNPTKKLVTTMQG